ncbi:Ig-like domain-containing protein [Gemmatimonas sp.]|uniref:InlB B-repeat-containing protein n=1 Tax=Gemmatimonas sp. TaxID=1962908 RepID=UPI00286BBD39|nr:Ig-like domain-containing protein [Gemmatimonas sp.]
MNSMKQPIRIGLTALAAAAAAALLAACSDPADVTSPDRNAPASIALTTSVMASQASVVQLKVQSAYLRQGGTTVDIGTQTITLSDVPTQQVPISIDLAACLADDSRAGLSAGTGSSGAALPPADDECVVRLLVELVLDGAAVDRQTVGPISLSPGVQKTVTAPIALNEVGTVRIDAPSANVVATGQPLRMEITRTMQLTAAVLDGAARVITGRTVNWTSSAPGVMTVNANGLVTAVTTGTATITAQTAGRVTTVAVRAVPLPAALTIVSTSTSGQATVRSAPAGIDCTVNGSVLTGTCAFTFPGDALVVLTTTPAALSELLSWTNDCSAATGTTCTIATSQSRLVGVALRAFRTLTITGTGNGTGSVTSPAGLNCVITAGITSGNCSINVTDGSSVTLTASATSPNSFRAWSGDCTSSTGNTCTLTMNTNRAPGARFDAPVLLTATPSGTGNGSIIASGVISCTRTNNANAGTCSNNVNFGTVVTLTASTGSFSTFVGWTGACTGSATTCQVTMDQARTVGATFTRLTGTVTFSLTGSGTGGVSVNGTTLCTKTPAFTSIGCSITLDLGSVVSLLAQPGANTGFVGYSGSLCSGSSLPCAFTLTGNAGVGLAFGPLASIVTVSPGANSTGAGTVSTADVSLNCAFSGQVTTGTCAKTVSGGGSITLTATGNANSTLSAWGGACSAFRFDPVCTFTPSSNVGVTARFVPAVAFNLAVYGGTGSRVTITSPTQNSSCLASIGSCGYKLIIGETIRLEATPGAGDSFTGWDAPCQEMSGSICTFVATVNTTSGQAYFANGSSIAPPTLLRKQGGGSQ